ncbi:alpha/beta fold hydrolase [Patescibacteria group bacterium]|nr:alpha/beta fold hydrolase [Patescibacteria group bacterium]
MAMHTKNKRIILYIFIFIISFIVISFWSAWLVTHPSRIESELTPENYNLLFEEITLTTKDGISIDGWFIPAPAPQKPALLILHGYPAEKGDLLFRASQLHQDFNILLIDFRYFGKSGGSFTTLGTNERLDLEAAIDFLESRGFKKVGVFGFSFGGATAILQAAKDDRIAAVVSYASFADLTLLGKDIYKHLPIIREALVPLIKFWANTFWDVDAVYSPKVAAQNLSTPILIIHSKQDDQIPFHHAELLMNALRNNERAEFYFPETGLHGELPADFDERVKYFFERYVTKQ